MNTSNCPSLLSEEDAAKYAGGYAAVSDTDGKVLCGNNDAVRVYEEIQRMGHPNAVIIYVPKPGEMFIYHQNDRQPLVDVYA